MEVIHLAKGVKSVNVVSYNFEMHYLNEKHHYLIECIRKILSLAFKDLLFNRKEQLMVKHKVLLIGVVFKPENIDKRSDI